MSSVSSTDGGYQYTQRKLSDLESEMRDETQRARDRYNERAELAEKNSQESIRKFEREAEENTNRYRDETASRIEKERESARADVERARAQNYDKFGRTQSELAYQQKRADEAIQQARDEVQNAKAKADRLEDDSVARANTAAQDRMTQNAIQDRESRERENGMLRKTINQMVSNENAYMKDKAQGSADARREIESEARTREDVITGQYGREIEQLKQKAKDADHAYARMEDENRRDLETKFAKTLQRVNQQHEKDMKYLNENAERSIAQVRGMAEKDGRNSAQALDRQADTLAEESRHALTSQADTFRREMAQQHEEDQGKIDRLEGQITNHITSGDQSWVSPAAETRMRENFMKEFDKKHQAQVSRDKNKTDELQKDYTNRLAETIEDSDRRVMRTEQQRRIEEHQQLQTYQGHIEELQHNQEQARRDHDYQTAHQAETLNRNYGSSLERQRREYEDMINQIKADSTEKITRLRQQADLDAKNAQRAFATQQYEIAKNHERKLEEQKNLYEDTISNLKEQLATQQHEAERRTRQLLDDQTRGHEQKIAQMEYQSKERERTISDNYQDQIEKLKRSNALLSQRKS